MRESLARPKVAPKMRREQEEELAAVEKRCALYAKCLVIPVNRLPLRGARYDVSLRDALLRAVHAMHAILSRMVMFQCSWCRERFPTFHPAFCPPPSLDMCMLKRQVGGVPLFNMEVAQWTEHTAKVGEAWAQRRAAQPVQSAKRISARLRSQSSWHCSAG